MLLSGPWWPGTETPCLPYRSSFQREGQGGVIPQGISAYPREWSAGRIRDRTKPRRSSQKGYPKFGLSGLLSWFPSHCSWWPGVSQPYPDCGVLSNTVFPTFLLFPSSPYSGLLPHITGLRYACPVMFVGSYIRGGGKGLYILIIGLVNIRKYNF